MPETNLNILIRDSVLKVGEVSEVSGQKVLIKVDKSKNSSDLFFNGEIVKNISVGSFIQVRKGYVTITIGKTPNEGMDINISVDKLFSSHIAIFGNTGSGKSNTLAKLYSSLFNHPQINCNEKFKDNCKYLLFDFNGEYSSNDCICCNKKVYKLSTYKLEGGDKIKLPVNTILDNSFFSIIAEATDKTQKPFIKRSLDFYIRIKDSDNPEEYMKNIIRKRINAILTMADKEKAVLLIDYLRNILPKDYDEDNIIDIDCDIDWNNKNSEYVFKPTNSYLRTNPDKIPNTIIYKRVDNFKIKENLLDMIISVLYLQLIGDVLSNRSVNEHIAPVINRLQSRKKDIDKIFEFIDSSDIWLNQNIIVVDLKNVNIGMKKIVPLIISKFLYEEQKKYTNKILNIIIDEAHNILSKDSSRESETWKDYRLETFEEIIKEGRKFGVFITISSQRPSDISSTIISQAHNYFIHRLVNQNDLKSIETSISYIDRITADSIPTLPVGTCIFNGISTQMPISLAVDKLDNIKSPNSGTINISQVIF
ncbi:MAG: ATP-binding protein [bacterium]